MKELLKRWAAVEPGRCQFTESDYLVLLNEEDWRYLAQDLTFWDLIWIQGVVQVAITARGWYFTLGNHPHKKDYWAVVNGGIQKIVRGSAPAEALLAAYVAALEATL